MRQVFVGRQPILDKANRKFGYELLFRASGSADRNTATDGDATTAQVLTRASTDIGLDELIGDKIGFINLSKHYLENPDLVMVLPQSRVHLEVLEDVPPTPNVIAGVRRLVDAGYTIVLDDFVPWGITASLREYASIVKYEYGAMSDVELRQEIENDHAA